MTSLSTFLTLQDYTRIPLKLTLTNHFEIEAIINGIMGRFILDTGASNTCIGINQIENFKLCFETSDIKAAGAGATDIETLMSINNTIQIGLWQKRRQKIVLFDLIHINRALTNHNVMPVAGIIGADLLQKGKAIIDYSKKALYLKCKS